MGNRRLSRSLALQALFAWDLAGKQGEADTLLERVVQEAADADGKAPGGDMQFMRALLRGVISKAAEIDGIIVKAAPEWPIEKIAAIDRNILRLGLYELLFADRGEVPPKVAINEAIELAKSFGSETSGKFVNGVLGAVYKDIGEPRKDEGRGLKAKADVRDLPCESLLGAVVFSENDGVTYLALVHDVFGRWTLSKGHAREHEDDAAGCARIVQEELGLSGEALAQIGDNQYVAADPEKGKVCKQVRYYLFRAPYAEVTLKECGGLDGAQWFPVSQVAELPMYEDIIPIIQKGLLSLTNP